MGQFIPRFSLARDEYSPFWQCVGFGSGINPCLRVRNQLYQYVGITDSVLPNCTGYAWGRFFEVYQQLRGSIPKGTPLCEADAGSWYNNSQVAATYRRSNVPQLGAIACWSGGSQGYGHVSIVEEIGDGYIVCSESGWTNYVNQQWVWTARLYGSPTDGYYNNYYYRGKYNFQGFILNDAATADASTLTSFSSLSGSFLSSTSSTPVLTADDLIRAVQEWIGKTGSALQKLMGLSDSQIQSGWGCAYLRAAAEDVLKVSSCPVKIANSATETMKQNAKSNKGTLTKRKKSGESTKADPGDLLFIRLKSLMFDDDKCDAVGVVVGTAKKTITCVFGDYGSATDRRFTQVTQVEMNRTSDFIYAVYHPNWPSAASTSLSNLGSVFANNGQLNIVVPSDDDAVLREFGYMNDKGEPSIITSDIRVSLINLVSPLSIVDGLINQMKSVAKSDSQFTFASSDANSVDVAGAAASTPITYVDSALLPLEKNTITYLRAQSNISLAGCVALLANASQECGGVGVPIEITFPHRNYDISQYVPDGPPGVYSRGMFMWNDNFNSQQYFPNSRLEDRCPNWKNNLSGQLDYLLYTLDMTDSRRMLRDRLIAAVNTEDGAAKAAADFCINYENPANAEQRAAERSQIARLMWRCFALVEG